MIEKSKFYHFLDEKNQFILRFIDGQALLSDIALLHAGQGPDEATRFSFFRDFILSSVHLLSYLKHHESMGLFIDSDRPFYRFKIELHEVGALRTLIQTGTKDDAQELDSKKVSAGIRLVKFSPHQSTPYTTHLEVDEMDSKELINYVLETSYQVQAHVLVSEKTDQSLLLMKLPKPSKKETTVDISLKEYLLKYKKDLQELISKNYQSEEEVQKSFNENPNLQSLQYLYGKEVEFRCSCSKKQMLAGISTLAMTEGLDDIFDGKETLETTCDYCHSKYEIWRNEVDSTSKQH